MEFLIIKKIDIIIIKQVVELKARLHCKACEKAVRKALCKIKGVRCVQIDSKSNKITVLGYMETKVIIKAIRKTGQKAEALPSSHPYEAPSPRLPTGFRCIIPRCGL
ncbi:heavy metal-associated isoprenylated plant protein 20-like [Hevea brasiliensis]|uniref:heavy metal-associated isoprenylated plant protein 20-like n=1 Tax=Hevea brasiliensis TaxID=3981 RepID=UPI0025FDC938|nr:heavy metal-associated isoprenylated plant protein 20-like [Hevea brasiliensis]